RKELEERGNPPLYAIDSPWGPVAENRGAESTDQLIHHPKSQQPRREEGSGWTGHPGRTMWHGPVGRPSAIGTVVPIRKSTQSVCSTRFTKYVLLSIGVASKGPTPRRESHSGKPITEI